MAAKTIGLFIPTWPDKPAANYGPDFSTSLDTSTSMWIPLRAKPLSDKVYAHGDNIRVWQDIAIRVWADKSGSLSVGFMAYDIYCAGLHQLSLLTKNLKWACDRVNKKVPHLNTYKLDELAVALLEVCLAVGITQTVEYHGVNQPETYAPVLGAVRVAVAEMNRRVGRLV